MIFWFGIVAGLVVVGAVSHRVWEVHEIKVATARAVLAHQQTLSRLPYAQ